MILRYAFLATYGEIGPDGRFTAVGGGVDGVVLQVLPFVLPNLALVSNVSFSPEECGIQHSMRMVALGPDGVEVMASASWNLSPVLFAPAMEKQVSMPSVVSVTQIELKTAGMHTFKLYCDEQEIGSVRLHVHVGPLG